MKLVIHLNDETLIESLIKHQVSGIVVGTKNFSSRGILKLDIEDIKRVVNKVNRQMEVFVLINQLYLQTQIHELTAFLKRLNEIDIDGILFQDFGVLNICQELNTKFKLIYAPDTLNTNHQTLNTLKHFGVTGAFLARELHLDEVNEIIENCELECMVQIHGVQYISHSRRKLLTNYLECIDQKRETGYQENFVIKVNNKEEYSHIFEDEFGTHILTQNELCTLDIPIHCDYGYIETMYMNNEYILFLIESYQQHLSYEALVNQYPQKHYDQGFLNDGTVYKIEDVRKREENEKG